MQIDKKLSAVPMPRKKPRKKKKSKKTKDKRQKIKVSISLFKRENKLIFIYFPFLICEPAVCVLIDTDGSTVRFERWAGELFFYIDGELAVKCVFPQGKIIFVF